MTARREGGTRGTEAPRTSTAGRPLLSVITIVRNAVGHLEHAMQSVLSQTYQPLEYIVVDGGSTDGSLEVIEKHADRLDYWVSEPDKGISDAMNKGIGLATGEWIAFLHADDFYPDPQVLSDVAAELERHPGALWLTGGLDIVDGNNRTLERIRPRRYSYSKLVRKNFILHPATWVSRKGFEAAGVFDNNYRYAMDYDLWLRLGHHAPPVRFDRQLACFRAHQDSRSVAGADRAYEEAWKIRKKFLEGHLLRTGLNYLYYSASKHFVAAYYRRLLSAR